MQKSIIDYIFLFDDHIYNGIGRTKEYEKISDKALKKYDQLIAELNEEQNKLFEEFVNLQMDEEAEAENIFFKAGLKMGLRLAFECIDG